MARAKDLSDCEKGLLSRQKKTLQLAVFQCMNSDLWSNHHQIGLEIRIHKPERNGRETKSTNSHNSPTVNGNVIS